MVLFSAKTGKLEALLLDNGYLTDIRTAAAGAIAARHLSCEVSKHVCIVGAGAQCCLQLKVLSPVRPIEQATIWARDVDKANRLAQRMSTELGINAHASGDMALAVSAAEQAVALNSRWYGDSHAKAADDCIGKVWRASTDVEVRTSP